MDQSNHQNLNEMQEKEKKRTRRLALIWIVLTMVVIVSTLLISSYAWFTNNDKVGTDLVSAKTNTADLTLLLSADGSSFSEESAIGQVNSQDSDVLMPVSTSDLKNWVYCTVSDGDDAVKFAKVKNEDNYYHGRIYLKAKSDGLGSDQKVDVYLDGRDSSGGTFTESISDSDLLNASRLGLAPEGSENVIFFLSSTHNQNADVLNNTVLNGVKLSDGQVISSSGSSLSAVKDPAVSMDDYTVTGSESAAVLPENMLMTINVNQVYTLDIYFYMEGCDSDCTNGISYDASSFHLAFLGVLSNE